MKSIAFSVLLCAFFAFTANADSVDQDLARWKEQGKKEGWTFEIADNAILRAPQVVREGLVVPKNWEDLAPWVSPPIKRDLPHNFDWREKEMVTKIRDQAFPQYCGSCWAHGTIAAFESAILIQSGRTLDLAPQQLVSCSPSYGTCAGGFFAFGFYQEKGANYEQDFPYQADDVPCKTDAPEHEKATSWAYVGARGRSPSTDEMKQAIYQYGPIAVTVSASGAWDAYKSGVYNACNNGMTNHIVAIVGWNDDDQAWIVKNSHGLQFGEQGYIRMKYVGKNGRKCNNIGQSAAFVVYKP